MVCLWFWEILGYFPLPQSYLNDFILTLNFPEEYQGWCGVYFVLLLFVCLICFGLYLFPFSPEVHILKSHPSKLNMISYGTKLVGVQEAFEEHTQVKSLNLGGPVRSQEADSMIFVVLLQLRILSKSMKITSCHRKAQVMAPCVSLPGLV